MLLLSDFYVHNLYFSFPPSLPVHDYQTIN
jgi:hypothetical protein